MDVEELIKKLESSGFECEAGPLILSEDWKNLKNIAIHNVSISFDGAGRLVILDTQNHQEDYRLYARYNKKTRTIYYKTYYKEYIYFDVDDVLALKIAKMSCNLQKLRHMNEVVHKNHRYCLPGDYELERYCWID